MAITNAVHAKAIDLIKLTAQMTTEAGSGHVTSAASLAHLVTMLMYGHMRYDSNEPDHPAADRLVLSEGHACPIVYAAAADLGLPIRVDGQTRPMTREDAMDLRALHSPVDGHPNPAEGFPFFPAATGSLGQGLSIANGLALAARLDKSPRQIFCLIGDGESREGQVWEAIDFLAEYNLKTVCPIFNCNHLGQSDEVSVQQSPEAIVAKLKAYGIQAILIDGHAPLEISAALNQHRRSTTTEDAHPVAIVARTTKAWGIKSAISGDIHGKAISSEDLDKALAELDQMAANTQAEWNGDDLAKPDVPSYTVPERKTNEPPEFEDGAQKFGHKDVLEKRKLATRKAYGIALQALGHANPSLVALDGDVKNSTYSKYFHDDPELQERFFESRIAEQNMISCAAGLAVGGKIPFVSTFGKFLTRGYDQLEMALVSRLPLRLVGSHVGVSLAADGPSQMALPDVGYFHAWSTVRNESGTPAIYLLNPSDAYSAYSLTVLMAEHDGASYLRTFRPDMPFLYDAETTFPLEGHHVVREGKDMLVIATGYMVHEALKAVESFHEQDIDPTIIDLYCLPFEPERIVELGEHNGGRVLTLEDNYGGGFGSAVAEALAAAGSHCVVQQMFVRKIPKSGRTPDEVIKSVGLSAKDIVQTAEGLLETAEK